MSCTLHVRKMGKPNVPRDPQSRLFWMLSSVITTRNWRFCHFYSTKQGQYHTICRIIPEEFRNKNAMCLFALASSVFTWLEMSKFRLPVKLQLCPWCVQDLWVQHLTSQCTLVHPNPCEDKYSRNLDNCSRTKEQLGCHDHTWRLPSTCREIGSIKDLHLQLVLNRDKLLWIYFPLRATVQAKQADFHRDK